MGNKNEPKLGINGLGRIGKLTLWHHVAEPQFPEIVVNLGRHAGTSLDDIAHYVRRDSTYGSLERYLHGTRGGKGIQDVDETRGTMTINETKVTFLREARNPKDIPWNDNGVSLVVDTTGRFRDPTLPADMPGGSIRGHLESGAQTVVVSAPFKGKDKGADLPGDTVTAIQGINECDYDPTRHRIVSGASCTTTCLAHMLKPLLDVLGAQRILTAAMSTIHAATGTQGVLDRLAQPGDTDLRKGRSAFNNIILTATGAATTLGQVLPAIKGIGFMAESVRIPATAGSLIILLVTLQEEDENRITNKDTIREIYRQAETATTGRYVIYTEEQNVSADIVAMPKAAAIIEGHEIHTRTAEVSINVEQFLNSTAGLRDRGERFIRVPVTQAVIHGWYDNELGGYVYMLAELTGTIARATESCSPGGR